MLPTFHVEILHLALDEVFSPRALKIIIKANLHQDRPRGQIGHDEYHFDNNAFDKSYAYLEEQRTLIVSSLLANDVLSAWSAFGRLTHTAQDFYAHSNYIPLWLSKQPANGTLPAPSEAPAMDPDLLHSGKLRSGKVYPLEVLTLIPGFRPLVLSVLPRDAHGWMNLDSPARGSSFQYAFQAAVKRTKIEFERTTKDLPNDLFALFVDQ